MMGLLGAINAYVTGFVLNELGEAETRRRTGLSDEEFRLSAAPYVQEQVIASGRYPHLARYVMEGEDRDADAEFAFGLNCLLDGIAAFKATSRS
ncbi:MAG: TetR/AcrR family transcriptional regulator C-terminal domain-containing protein [Chloroflexi bacterium]|nr:TetR/AcrR family transcriptional regulator C-terminal domain-containing protein [Chloroflexota bacterium]